VAAKYVPRQGSTGKYPWAVAVATELTAPVVAIQALGRPALHLEHLPERLGCWSSWCSVKSIAAVAVGIHETRWERATVTVAVLGFVAAAGLWWTQFYLPCNSDPHPHRASDGDAGALVEPERLPPSDLTMSLVEYAGGTGPVGGSSALLSCLPGDDLRERRGDEGGLPPLRSGVRPTG
jgi:hypothetical protein